MRRENLQFSDDRMDGEGGGADPLILQRRAEIKDAYARLLVEHPVLPPEIRDFQVQLETCSLVFNCSQADVTAAVLSQDSHHILSSVPTGWGKTLPMLLAALLMPPGDTIPYFFLKIHWIISPQAQQLPYWCP